MKDFKDKVAVITGAASGIGFGFQQELKIMIIFEMRKYLYYLRCPERLFL